MLQIELVPDLSHCIETLARKVYSEVVRQLMTSGEGNRELEEMAELLRIFLDTMDFGRLRSESERHLGEGRNVKFVVYLEDGVSKYEMQIS